MLNEKNEEYITLFCIGCQWFLGDGTLDAWHMVSSVHCATGRRGNGLHQSSAQRSSGTARPCSSLVVASVVNHTAQIRAPRSCQTSSVFRLAFFRNWPSYHGYWPCSEADRKLFQAFSACLALVVEVADRTFIKIPGDKLQGKGNITCFANIVFRFQGKHV
jgi:hypothetical protein